MPMTLGYFFKNRCMGDDTMASEYTDSEQQLAVSTSEYDQHEDSIENDKKHIMAVKETEDSFIVQYAKVYDEDEEEDISEDAKEMIKDFIEVKSELKAYHDEEESKEYGLFEGYGSVFGNKDLGNDVIEKGAFAKSIKRRTNKGVKLLYQHKSDMPIGVFDEIREDDHGLVVKGRLALKTQAGAEAYELLKMGALDGLSIGFRVNPSEVSYDKRNNKRIIKEVDLMEVSLVTFPMNPQATVRSVKGEQYSIREWEKGLRDAFNLSRSESKVAAKAVTDCFGQREVDSSQELVDAIKNLTLTLKS
jgi:uncharacterized protein